MSNQWIALRLGDVCSKIGSGATPRGGSSVYLETGETALIRSQNVYNEGFRRDGLVYISEEHAEQLRNVEVRADDVLLNITGDSVARCCQVATHILPARVNQHVSIIRPDPGELDARFLRYSLVSPQMQEMMLSWAGAGGTRNALTKGMIESFQVFAPRDVTEQQAIASILGTLDDKIDLNRRMNETLEAMAQAIFKSWFVDFLPVHAKQRARTQTGDPVRARAAGEQPPGLAPHIADLFPDAFEGSELGEIPKGWELATVNGLANINELSLSKTDPLDVIDYVEISKVMRGDISEIVRYERGTEPSRARRRLRHGDTALSTVRPDRGAHFLCLDPPETLIASTGFAVLSPKDGCWAFLYTALTLPEIGETLGRLADGAAYPAVRSSVVGNLKVVTPEDQELVHVFERIAEPLYEKADRNRNQSYTLTALRDTLLPKLISGELRVPEAESLLMGVGQ